MAFADQPAFHAKVVRVVDGDTLEVRREKKNIRIRIWGIDAPEWSQPYGPQSCGFARNLIFGREVQVVPKDHDKYGRLVAVIFVEGVSVNEALVRAGYAWVYPYFCNEPVCEVWKSLQQIASSEHRGLWADQSPVPPWQWRRMHDR
ncbi:MAG: thermonuclease family protein [Desulfocapsaceae bacterium]|nr:thermonuclease family protein [Desulfocapsaceae bacterium]